MKCKRQNIPGSNSFIDSEYFWRLLIFGMAELESWRIEVYQIGYYDLGLDNRIKQMVWYWKIIMIKQKAHNEIWNCHFCKRWSRLDVNVSPSEDTVWLSLADMCLLFSRDKSVISRHIKNVILENNLDVNQVVAKNATTVNDGKTYIVSFYNLDVIIPLGYKVHSLTFGQKLQTPQSFFNCLQWGFSSKSLQK